MKTKLLFLFFLLFQMSNAQNITFTDPVLKNFLVNSSINFSTDPNNIISYPPIDANGDGEISQAEALNVIGLSFYYTDITNLEGLQYFTNLKVFSSYYVNFTTFNQPSLVNLEELSLSNSVGSGALAFVNVSNNTNLVKFQCSGDLITSLDLSNNVALKVVDIFCPSLVSVNFNNLVNLKSLGYLGKLPTIDISDSVNLLNLSCIGSTGTYSFPLENRITSIDLSNQVNLINLDLTGNNLTSLDLSNCQNLESIAISQNNISTLNIDGVNYVKTIFCQDNLLTSLNVDGMFNLQALYCNNNQLTSLSTKNDIIEEYIDFSGNPDLATICCDANEVVYMQNQCLQNDNSLTEVNSDCGSGSGESRVAMYPNPVVDMLHLSSDKRITKIELFSLSGLKVMNDESESNVMDLSQLQSGMYFVKVYSGDKVTNMKIVKN
ncbi:T9SS type A sorting domain-containing protein [Flavobacterium sp.]|uniref:T9SS type A sorting domain-containing protein n=1 Tax=Flavobacterium sp. TaxID=239 RepID=UPI00262F1353|nr:T9SS type A sorting domain-containing protein [Flavobacterium sp.]